MKGAKAFVRELISHEKVRELRSGVSKDLPTRLIEALLHNTCCASVISDECQDNRKFCPSFIEHSP